MTGYQILSPEELEARIDGVSDRLATDRHNAELRAELLRLLDENDRRVREWQARAGRARL